MAFERKHRGPALLAGDGGSSERPDDRASDPTIRNVGAVTTEITLADDAEYDLDGVSNGVYEVRWNEDERPVTARFDVRSKASVAFSASAISSNVLTLTVASGASEGIQPGQWIRVDLDDPSLDANDSLDGSYVLVTSTTATTIVAAFTAADEAAMGAGDVTVDAVVFAQPGAPTVLWDSIIAADNQDENLGSLGVGIYTVISDGFHETMYSDGTALLQYAQNVTDGSAGDITHDEVDDATSDTLTALFVSSGDVLLRNGADVATKLTVIFQPLEGVGLDQDGFHCFFARNEALRLRNRSGATETYSVKRVS